jgi:hydroxymethylglutaryl-CoA lyase
MSDSGVMVVSLGRRSALAVYTMTFMVDVEIVEVSPRDGLQNERVTLPTETKVELVERCAAAGARRIEAVSFARPDRVPQLADAEAVLAALGRRPELHLSGLVLNRKGLDRAIAAGLNEVNAVVLCTETFSQQNQGMSVTAAVSCWLDIASTARDAGVKATVTLSAAFGCPFEGVVPIETVLHVFEQVIDGAPAEVVFADTIGVGVPNQVRAIVAGCNAIAPDVRLRGHFHDTRRTGIANALAAVECGIAVLDASAGGVGGCPFAPSASGNIATEDLIYALHRSGWDTGLDPLSIAAIGTWLADQLCLNHVPASLGRAGWFGPLLTRAAE